MWSLKTRASHTCLKYCHLLIQNLSYVKRFFSSLIKYLTTEIYNAFLMSPIRMKSRRNEISAIFLKCNESAVILVSFFQIRKNTGGTAIVLKLV